MSGFQTSIVRTLIIFNRLEAFYLCSFASFAWNYILAPDSKPVFNSTFIISIISSSLLFKLFEMLLSAGFQAGVYKEVWICPVSKPVLLEPWLFSIDWKHSTFAAFAPLRALRETTFQRRFPNRCLHRGLNMSVLLTGVVKTLIIFNRLEAF